MLMTTAAHLAFQPSPSGLPYSVRCAFMNAFTVPARALTHFFWPEPPIRESDVLAADYFGNGPRTPPPHPDALNGVREGVGKFIVHISYDRPDPGGEKQWQFATIALAIDEHVRTFQADVEKLDPSLLDDDHWRRLLRVAEREAATAQLRAITT